MATPLGAVDPKSVVCDWLEVGVLRVPGIAVLAVRVVWAIHLDVWLDTLGARAEAGQYLDSGFRVTGLWMDTWTWRDIIFCDKCTVFYIHIPQP